jgi:hypothetical protein
MTTIASHIQTRKTFHHHRPSSLPHLCHHLPTKNKTLIKKEGEQRLQVYTIGIGSQA